LTQIVLFFPKTAFHEEWSVLPLALLYPAAILKDSGYQVKIIDARVTENWKECLAQAVAREPLFFGVSSMTGHQISGGLEASRLVRSLSPQVPVVWGGVHPSLLPEETLKTGPVDIVVRGEGEVPVRLLAQALKHGRGGHGIPGVSLIEQGEVIHNPEPEPFDLDAMPSIPYELVPLGKYRQNSPWKGTEGSIPFLTSKGCPFHCAYCYSDRFYRNQWRAKSPSKVISELKEMQCLWNPLKIFLLDDNFFVDLNRVEAIAQGILTSALRPEIFNVNCRVDTLLSMDISLLKALKEAGMVQLFVGVESGSEKMLQSIRKGFTPAMILEANQKLRRAAIEPVYSFMAGFPGETISDVRDTLRLMVRLLEENPGATITELSFYSPFPGTELMNRCKTSGVSVPARLEDWAGVSYNRLAEELFSMEEVEFLLAAKVMSSQLDHKYTQRKGNVKKLLATIFAWEIKFRIKTGLVRFFPEKIFVKKYWRIKYLRKRK